ncbi:MAG: DEAD/DEAH box helicase [Sulfuriferula sp.]
MELRPYQTAAIQEARVNLASGKLRQIVYAPTGAGKTIIGIELIRGALRRGKRVAFIANRIGLVGQTSKRLSQAGIAHGILQGENTRGLDQPVIVCSIQTVSRRRLPDVDVIVIDEAHAVAGSQDYRRVLFQNNALPVIGLTATPFSRGLGQSYPELGGEPLFQGIVKAATIRELIGLGYLVDCAIFAPAEPDLSGVRLTRNAFGEMDYSESDLAGAVDKPSLVGDIVIHWQKLANDKPTVCFATNIAHSKHIADAFNAAGVKAEHVDAYTEEDERAAILQRVESGETKVISNVGILTEGWDFPACEVMILARPTRSLIRWVQMAGRILRPYPGKSKGIILDHSGSALQLGYPTDDLPLELCDGKPKHGKAGKPKPAEPKKCPSCAYVKPPKVHACPACGFAPERQNDVTTQAGDLVEFTRTKGRATHAEKQAVYSGLAFIADQHGYKAGWVSNQYRAYFGVWPRDLYFIPRPPTPELTRWVKSRQIRFAKGREVRDAA